MSTSGTGNNNAASATNDPLQENVLALTFNQDSTGLSIGTEKTYYLFGIKQGNTTDQAFNFSIKAIKSIKRIQVDQVHIIERAFSSALLALVTEYKPRHLNLYDIRLGNEIGDATIFPTNILAVKMSQSRIVVCLEEAIWFIDRHNLKKLHTIRDVKLNSNGLCALSAKDDNPYLAYPTANSGNIHIFHTAKFEKVTSIIAHNGPVVALSFDMSGAKIATASVKGTVIRIYNVLDGTLLFELRRGTLQVATIYSLAFSPDSAFLAASSNTGTIHIFRLMNPTPNESAQTGSWIGNLLGIPRILVPKQISQVWTQDRSFATVYLQSGAMKTTIAINFLNGKLVLFVAGYDAVLSAYEINTTDGGECPLIRSQYLLGDVSVMENSMTKSTIQNSADEPVGIYPPDLVWNDNAAIFNASESAKTDKS